MNFVVQFSLRTRDNKIYLIISPKVHFLMIYIFEFFHSLVFIFRHVYSKTNRMLIEIRLRCDAYENGT